MPELLGPPNPAEVVAVRRGLAEQLRHRAADDRVDDDEAALLAAAAALEGLP
jgi:hypothetical protein